MPLITHLRSRRGIVAAAIAATAAAGSLGPVALASGHRSHVSKRPAPAAHGPGPAARDAVAAMQRLVRHGVIDQRQAAAVDREITAGSVDPQTLVGAGIVTGGQMQAITAAIDQVKLSFGG